MESTEEKNYHDPNTTVYWNPRHRSYTLEPLEENSAQMTYAAAVDLMNKKAGA